MTFEITYGAPHGASEIIQSYLPLTSRILFMNLPIAEYSANELDYVVAVWHIKERH